MTFTRKLITVQLALAGASQTFGAPGQNTLTVSNPKRVSIRVSVPGGQDMATCKGTIWGMTEQQMNAASTYGHQPLVDPAARVAVAAGDAVIGQPRCFDGTVTNAWADFADVPNVPFHFEARAGLDGAVLVLPPASVRGPVSATTLLAALASKMNRAFENNSNVAVSLSSPYFRGSARDQIVAICEAARINWADDGHTIAVWPSGQPRQSSPGQQTVTISPQTGMVGYPTFVATGIVVRSEYNPVFRQGINVRVQSDLKPACGTWSIVTMQHELDSEVFDGLWFSTLQLAPPGDVAVPQ